MEEFSGVLEKWHVEIPGACQKKEVGFPGLSKKNHVEFRRVLVFGLGISKGYNTVLQG